MKERAYHSSLILWNIDAVFSFDYKGEKGTVTICLGGYIPCPDHRIAPDAKFEVVQYYCEKMQNLKLQYIL